MTIQEYIEKTLPMTIRENKEDLEPLFGLPYPYIIPSAKDMFQEMYYWDTYFANKGLILRGELTQVKNNIDDLRTLLERFGFVLNGSHMGFRYNSQPPFLAMMIRELYDVTKDQAWLLEAYGSVKKEHAFWMEKRNTPCGLNRYDCEELPKSWIKNAADCLEERLGFRPDKTEEELARGMYAAGESGWDLSPRMSYEVYNYAPADLNSLLYRQEKELAYFASELGLSEECEEWEKAAKERGELCRRYLKDENGNFFDYNYVTGERISLANASCFYPLYSKMATKEEAEAAVKLLPRIEMEYGIACCEKSDREGVYQWGYPNGWPPTHSILVEGLLNYGYEEEALRIAKKYVQLVERCFEQTENFWEKYNVVEGNVEVTDEYKMPAMLGWTFGVYESFQKLIKEKEKKVVLLGDSIRLIGYGEKTAELLKDTCKVWQPEENCRFAKYTLRMLFDYQEQIKGADVIHWNNGLWDCSELFGDGTFTSLEEYIENMLRIARILQSYGKKVIFATTTPTHPDYPYNKLELIRKFNDALVPKLQEMGIEINDLFSLMLDHREDGICEDQIHLNALGTELCAAQTAKKIRKALLETDNKKGE